MHVPRFKSAIQRKCQWIQLCLSHQYTAAQRVRHLTIAKALLLQGRQEWVAKRALLNAIDGVAAQEGRVIFLTTNHKERLTEALIRPGRVDVQRYLGNASKDGAGKLFDQFFRPGSDGAQDGDNDTIKTARSDFLDQVEPHVHSFAQLQGILMDSRNDPSLAAKCLRATYQEESELFDIASLNKQLHRHRSSRIERLDDKFEGRLAMMEHACKCNRCSSKACQKWKYAISHINAKECKNEFNCEKIQSIARLAMVHARKCTSGDCPAPFCGLVQHQKDEEEKAYVKELWEKLKTPPTEQDKERSQYGTNEEKQDGAKGGTAAESSGLNP